jgi:hypothetical protein
LLLYSSYLPLGVPNWTVKNHQHRAASGSSAGGTEEEYVHLDDADLDDDLDTDDLAYLELPTDEEAAESAA